MYVCIEIYTLQLYITDLTLRGCHTLRQSHSYLMSHTDCSHYTIPLHVTRRTGKNACSDLLLPIWLLFFLV